MAREKLCNNMLFSKNKEKIKTGQGHNATICDVSGSGRVRLCVYCEIVVCVLHRYWILFSLHHTSKHQASELRILSRSMFSLTCLGAVSYTDKIV